MLGCIVFFSLPKIECCCISNWGISGYHGISIRGTVG